MAIENRNLEPGTKLIAKYKKEEYRAEVIAGEEGKVKYRLANGREFKSPSAADTAITSKACNGWAFWSLDTGAAQEEPPETEAPPNEDSEPEKPLPEDSPEAAEEEQKCVSVEEQIEERSTAATFRRVPNQRGVEGGQVRLYCDACQGSFTSPAGLPVVTCPEGHYPGDSSEA